MASFGPSIRYNSTTLRNLNLDYKLRRSTRRRLFTFNILCKPQRFAIGVRQTIDRPTSRIDTNNVSFDCPRLRSSLLKVRIDRHATPPSAALACGCFNVRSLNNKVDDLLDVRREQLIDVLFLVETWHDSDSVCISRLRANGFQVIDRPRPRSITDTLATNHGGVAAVGAPGVQLTLCDFGVRPLTFELLSVRVVVGTSSFIAAVIYRPGSSATSPAFFNELVDVTGRLATFAEPVILVGDINIRLDRVTDPPTIQFDNVLAMHGLARCVSDATHDLGGILDVVVFRSDLLPAQVDVLDIGLSDHRMLKWLMPLSRPPPVYSTLTGRSWPSLDVDTFRTALLSSSLGSPDVWPACSVDELAAMYHSEISIILDRFIPIKTSRCMRRASDPWFDRDCRDAKRRVRRLERAVCRENRKEPNDNTGAVAAATIVWTDHRREYRKLLRQKRQQFWTSKVDSERSTPRQLWRSIDALLGRGRPSTLPAISANALHKFFNDKVDGVRASTSDAPAPSFTTAPESCSMHDFQTLTVEDITSAVCALPDKQCASDPLPTRLLKEIVDVLAPFLTELFNRSLLLGVVPSVFKTAFITPLLKKPNLDSTVAKSYRPISNLPVLSKLLERLVARQLLHHLTTSQLLPDRQSAYRANHSTETAVLKVLADILSAVDSGDLALLTLLDLSAAFDTVDHETLLQRLATSYGLGGCVYGWFVSYLESRTQYVRLGTSQSTPTTMVCGVPQGSVLGPILFLLYTADLQQLIENHGLIPHLFADDTQIYGSCRPGSSDVLQNNVSVCIDHVRSWMRSNRLQLNAEKTETIWCASVRRQSQIPTDPLLVCSESVAPVRSTRDLGIYIDSDLSMNTHITKTVSSCFAVLRQLRSIRQSVSRPVLITLVVSLVLTRLDYGSTVLVGLPACQMNRLQSVLNAAARLINSARKFDHITPLLRDLHWLRIRERITFRVAVLAYRCLHDLGPSYLAAGFQRVADVDSRRHLRSASSAALIIPPSTHVTIGDRAFPVAAAKTWNSLSSFVTSSPSLTIFRRRLKTELFSFSYS